MSLNNQSERSNKEKDTKHIHKANKERVQSEQVER